MDSAEWAHDYAVRVKGEEGVAAATFEEMVAGFTEAWPHPSAFEEAAAWAFKPGIGAAVGDGLDGFPDVGALEAFGGAGAVWGAVLAFLLQVVDFGCHVPSIFKWLSRH